LKSWPAGPILKKEGVLSADCPLSPPYFPLACFPRGRGLTVKAAERWPPRRRDEKRKEKFSGDWPVLNTYFQYSFYAR